MASKKETGDRNFALNGLATAHGSLDRLMMLLAEKGQPTQTLISGPTEVNESNLSAAYSEAVNAELKVLRAQLYSTGLFKKIENIEL